MNNSNKFKIIIVLLAKERKKIIDMKLKTLYIYILFIVTYSCESEANRNDKLIINKHNTEDLNRHIINKK